VAAKVDLAHFGACTDSLGIGPGCFALSLTQSRCKAEWLKKMARLPDNYYLAIADDLKEEDIAEKRTSLIKLCRAIVEAP
jgi:hypothetical protein